MRSGSMVYIMCIVLLHPFKPVYCFVNATGRRSLVYTGHGGLHFMAYANTSQLHAWNICTN